MTGQSHAAAGSFIGYLYQARVALWLAYERMYDVPNLLVTLELLDDVQFDAEGTPTELLQTKHHSTPCSLTDMSPDLWKTLGIWLERSKEEWAAERYVLLTTAQAGDDSAAAVLRASDSGRDVATAYSRLLKAAEASDNAATAGPRDAFRSLDDAAAKALLSSVYVVDSAPVMGEVAAVLKRLFRAACPPGQQDVFLEYLEGWWFARVVAQLAGDTGAILAEEIEAKVGDLRQNFLMDALPVHEDIMAFDDTIIDAEFYRRSVFVRQLEIAGISEIRILKAILDYYKAREQRSRWVREDLVLVGELNEYERRLVDEWERFFAQVGEQYGPDVEEERKRDAARAVFNWAQQDSQSLRLRPRCDEPFVQRGSYQILADDLRVGWHPEFKRRVVELLGA